MKLLALGIISLALIPPVALAQAYPSKPVRIVVPAAAGGGVDTVARAIASRLGETLGQPVVVENRSGANTIIGTDLVAKSAPDGYTLLLNTGPPHGAFNFFTKNLPFDSMADFTAITMVGVAPQSLVVHASLPVHSVKELIDYGKKNPGKLSYGTAGIGTSQHIGGALLNRLAGIDMVHVAYKGGALALNDLLGAQIPVAMTILSNVLVHVRSGKLRLLAVLGAQRAKAAPDTPTIAESVPGYVIPDTWIGLTGPAKLPPAIVNQLNAAVLKSLGYPDVRARLAAAGFEVIGNSAQEFESVLNRSVEIYRKITSETGIRPE